MKPKRREKPSLFYFTKGGGAVTEKQKRFADEYLIDFNASRAYRAAYLRAENDNTAAVNASKLLRNTKVAEYIEKRIAERSGRTEVTQDRVIKELAGIGFAPKPMDRAFEIKVSDKLKALELLGKHLGMFTDKQIVANASLEEFLERYGDDYEY